MEFRKITDIMRLKRAEAGLLIVDIQAKLANIMPREQLHWMIKNCQILIETAKVLGLPIWITEQYPKGLGPTIPEIADLLPAEVKPISKVDFSCAMLPEVVKVIEKSGKTQLIVCGMETHICVYQTVRDFITQDYTVFVPRDAVVSRIPYNLDVGLNLMERAGAFITSTESVVFDLLECAGTPEFKEVSKLIK